ncbi:MAG: succinate dehydrogenase assembly factor 2 [Pseudomonadales bacterium]|nr:succinate dehydrogenase assembly factor 2 [Pseudomonadales bacterium]
MSEIDSGALDPKGQQTGDEQEHFRRLQWQCRRGIKEVEVLLVPFFDQCYRQLDSEDQRLFEKLLDQHDVDMFEWFTHRSKPEQPDLARMVAMVLARAES